MARERKDTAVWIVTGLTVLVFVAGAAGKLSGQAQAVDNFHKWGLSDGFRLFVGVIELVGAVGLVIPATATLAASGLAVVMVGATFTHLANHEGPMFLLPVVLLGLLLFIANRRRAAIGSLLGAAEAH